VRGKASAPVPADNYAVERITVECLQCGHSRAFAPGRRRDEKAGDCPRCGYVGWAHSTELSERMRKLFRDLPVERRLRLRLRTI
jgi:Zn ribbon nucleic-acid-binding protein